MKLFAILLLTSLLFTACSDPLKSRDRCPCKVMVPQLQPDGSYKREVVELKTLEDPRSVSSSVIRITLNPRFFTDGSVDETTPNAQYIVNKDGVMVSKRALTEEMFASYKAMEDLYFYDRQIGSEKYLKYPRVLSFETKSNRKRRDFNNASFITMFDRVVLFKYFGNKLALSFNPGVVAHEHFHAIFASIIKPIESTLIDIPSSLAYDDEIVETLEGQNGQNSAVPRENVGYNFLLLKSIDEGLADFWAHLHTDLTNPYLASYKFSEMGEREVLPRVVQLESQVVLNKLFNYERYLKEASRRDESDHDGNVIHSWIYNKGTSYSNLFKSLSMKVAGKAMDAHEQKVLVGKWIIRSLERLSETVKSKDRLTKLSQVDVLNAFVDDSDLNVKTEMCSDLQYFLVQHNQEGLCRR